MNFFKSIFKRESKDISSNECFWNWFVKHERTFYKVVNQHLNIEKEFFAKLTPQLKLVEGNIWFLAGMFDDQTAELILTADGSLKNIAFVEELMAEAPVLDNWKFTCLKQPAESSAFSIKMSGYTFDETTMSFYAITHLAMPDEIDIVITHKDLNKDNVSKITMGIYLWIDNALGEINSVTMIDNLDVIHPSEAIDELVPLEKLSSFLNWREKEFIEKYQGVRTDSDNDTYKLFEGTLKNGLPTMAIINSDLLQWDKKVSHQWIGEVKLSYNGVNNNGLPDGDTYVLLDKIEDELMKELRDLDGYLNIGRETGNGLRNIYFACADFRRPSLVFYEFQKLYSNEILFEYDIYKDKYWRSFDRFKIK